MNKVLNIDDQFRITIDFIIAWIVLAIPSLWLARPWNWDVPTYSILAAIAFIPFATTIVLYCPIMFIRSVIISGKRGWLVAKTFFGVILLIASVLVLAFIFGGFEPIDSWLVVLVSAWAIIALNKKIRAERHNPRSQSSRSV